MYYKCDIELKLNLFYFVCFHKNFIRYCYVSFMLFCRENINCDFKNIHIRLLSSLEIPMISLIIKSIEKTFKNIK